jgi:hypothetical protein
LIMIYKTLLRKIKMSNTNPTKKTGVHSRAPEELAVPVPLVISSFLEPRSFLGDSLFYI